MYNIINKYNMCWSFEISIAAAVYGYLVSYYLKNRNYSIRDKWYALFLATFTTTQLFDAIFWYMKGEEKDVPCVPMNYFVSKYFLPPVLFFQPWVLSLYPSKTCKNLRPCYRLLTICGCLLMVLIYGCSKLWHAPPDSPLAHDKYPTILWGGIDLPVLLVNAGIGFWAIGACMFVTPLRYSLQILLVGGCVLSLLYIFDGTITLLSKMCTYCLLLSIVWTLEPLWDPPSGKYMGMERENVNEIPYHLVTLVEKCDDDDVEEAVVISSS